MGFLIRLISSSILLAGVLGFNQPISILNDLRDFQPLYFSDNRDYYLSNKRAGVEQAAKVCSSLGENFHLVTLENEDEYTLLLPYLRSLEIDSLWTCGVRFKDSNTTSKDVWAAPQPASVMNYTNFATPSRLARLSRYTPQQRRDLPRCKNGFLVPRCAPIDCDVTMKPCTTETKPCTLDPTGPCEANRPEGEPCRATCNNCVIEQPDCVVIQKPCIVEPTKCIVTRPPCSISTPDCETTRDECETFYPPCVVTTPKPCVTTRRTCPPKTTTAPSESCTTTRPPCAVGGDEKCEATNVTFCKTEPDVLRDYECEQPEICQPGAIICPNPITICPEPITVCKPVTIVCPTPTVFCPEPEANCPKPTVQCTPAKVVCDAPEVSCPNVVVTCPRPTYTCEKPVVHCPPPDTVCEPWVPCEFPEPPPPCPSMDSNEYIEESEEEEEEDNNGAVDGPVEEVPQLTSGCIAMKKETDFKWEVQSCAEEKFFVCEGR